VIVVPPRYVFFPVNVNVPFRLEESLFTSPPLPLITEGRAIAYPFESIVQFAGDRAKWGLK
jgi:hypothetical protein